MSNSVFGSAMWMAIAELRHHRRPLAATRLAARSHMPARDKLAVDGRPALPVLELHRPQPMAYPLVDGCKDPWRLGDPEVGLPSRQVRPQFLAHGREASPGAAPGQRADVLLHALQGLWSHAPLDLPSRRHPEREAEELAFVARATALLASLTRSLSRQTDGAGAPLPARPPASTAHRC